MQRILDVDLDLFVTPIKDHGPADQRPEDGRYSVWTDLELASYLETTCGLQRPGVVPGAFFREHDELFWHLRDEIEAGALAPPFDLVHLDAHADFGMGSYETVPAVLFGLLHEEPAARIGAVRRGPDGINLGNWLLYAIACRWIGRLQYVHHPGLRLSPGPDDLPDLYFKEWRSSSGEIQLRAFNRDADRAPSLREATPAFLEPSIPIVLTERSALQRNQRPFDRVFFTWSPGYVPPTADRLCGVARSFLASH